MADYAEMKEKLRREGMAEQKAKLDSTAGTPAQTSMRYGSMTDAEEKAAAAKPAPMFEAAPIAGAASATEPKATVRGVPDEMMAEYIPAGVKQSAAAPVNLNSPEMVEMVARVKKANAAREGVDDTAKFFTKAGFLAGGAIGAGLGGPAAPLTVPIGAGLGAAAGMLASSSPGLKKERAAAQTEYDAVTNDMGAAFEAGTMTPEALSAALGPEGWVRYKGKLYVGGKEKK
jgi:hypothetical protein